MYNGVGATRRESMNHIREIILLDWETRRFNARRSIKIQVRYNKQLRGKKLEKHKYRGIIFLSCARVYVPVDELINSTLSCFNNARY